ncbi:hypothetical protein ACX80D_06520 [Arthrobacter sp. Sr24]
MSSSTPVTSRQRQNAGNQPAKSAGIPVLPAVDVNRGAVSFQTPNGFHDYQTQEPEQLATALTQAVRPARWIPELGTLVITVAQNGVRAGRNVGFRLSTF